VPGRHARLGDFLVDAVAICAGSIAGSWAKASDPSAFDMDSTIH